MNIEIRAPGLEDSETIRAHAEGSLHSHLGRFDGELTAAVVHIGDVNGPKGGRDKRCHITVHGPKLRASTADSLSADVYTAVDAAAERIARVVAHGLERARTLQHAGPSLRRTA